VGRLISYKPFRINDHGTGYFENPRNWKSASAGAVYADSRRYRTVDNSRKLRQTNRLRRFQQPRGRFLQRQKTDGNIPEMRSK
jgi:hypothetical protein